MKHIRITTTIAALAISSIFATSAHAHDSGSISHKNDYLRSQVTKLPGDASPGRDIVRYGLSDGTDASYEQIRTYFNVMRRMIAPNVQMTASPAGVSTSQTPLSLHTPASGLPSCTWKSESGGNYRAYNAASGAAGKYQIMPGTWKAYGGSGASAVTASEAEQDRVAAAIYAAEGGSPWVNC